MAASFPPPPPPPTPPVGGGLPSPSSSNAKWVVLGAIIGAVAVGGVLLAFLGLRSGGASTDGTGLSNSVTASVEPSTTLAEVTTVAPATSASTSSAAPTVVPTTLPFGLPQVFPSSVPPEACTADRIIADTGQPLGIEVFCRGAWSTNVISAECGECESLDVFRWTGDRWVHRGNFYAFCISTLTASGLPPAFAQEVGFDGDACGSDIVLRPEPEAGPLEVSDEGARVRRLQLALIARGLLFDDADGQYGPNTEAAVIDLQYFLGIDPDGTAGAEVHAALMLPYA